MPNNVENCSSESSGNDSENDVVNEIKQYRAIYNKYVKEDEYKGNNTINTENSYDL